MTRSASIAEVKASLSKYLARVKAGEEVLVTDRGRPVARLVRYEGGDAATEDLVRRGLMVRGTGRLGRDFWSLPRPSDPQGRVLAALLEERRDGR